MQNTLRYSSLQTGWNRFITYIRKPQNAILLVLGILLTITTIAPMISIAVDTVAVHVGSVDTRGE